MGEAKRRQERNRAVSDQIAKATADQGRLIEFGWFAAQRVLQWDGKSEAERRDLRLAFYTGAQHLWGSIMGLLDPGVVVTDDDLSRMDLIGEELDSFAREMTALLGEPGGRS